MVHKLYLTIDNTPYRDNGLQMNTLFKNTISLVEPVDISAGINKERVIYYSR